MLPTFEKSQKLATFERARKQMFARIWQILANICQILANICTSGTPYCDNVARPAPARLGRAPPPMRMLALAVPVVGADGLDVGALLLDDQMHSAAAVARIDRRISDL